MPYGKMKKKMGCSGGGPNMYKMGSKENNSPANFSNKAMKYMEKMPAMYGKPKMGEPVGKNTTSKEKENLIEKISLTKDVVDYNAANKASKEMGPSGRFRTKKAERAGEKASKLSSELWNKRDLLDKHGVPSPFKKKK